MTVFRTKTALGIHQNMDLDPLAEIVIADPECRIE